MTHVGFKALEVGDKIRQHGKRIMHTIEYIYDDPNGYRSLRLERKWNLCKHVDNLSGQDHPASYTNWHHNVSK